VLFVQEVLGADPEPYQAAILRAVAAGKRRVAVRSGHGVGKTTTLAWLIIWHICTRFPQKTVCTAPTTKQLFDALAAETKSWMRKLPKPILDLFDIQVEQIRLLSAPEESFVSFRVSKAEVPEALAGVHSDNVLLIPDEASGVPDPVFEAAAGSMSGHNACTVLAGNPVRTSGLFYDAFHKLSDMWEKFHVSCLDSERVTADFIEDMRRRYGEDSNGYRVRVLGEFPLSDDDTLISRELAAASLTRDVMALDVRPIWGVDCARFGADRSSLAKRRGNVLDEPVKSWKGLDTMQLVGRVKFEWDNTLPSQRPSEICVDVIGIGAGVVDRLTELGLPARGINVSESPAMTARFPRLKDELWWLAREWFEARDTNLCNDGRLLEELVAVRYTVTDSTGKVKVESKSELKKRTGASPDLADAFVLTFASTAISASSGSYHAQSWKEPIRRVIKGLV
jgi:phage terminase large subunit